jgi:transposase
MARTRKRYPPEFSRLMVELVRKGRTPEELSASFEPSAGAIRNWVEQMDEDGHRMDGLTSQGRKELRELHRENKGRM